MNENAKKWIAALRSGQYKQGHSQLRSSNNNFCCLGIACELAVEANITSRYPPQKIGGGFEYGNDMYRFQSALPPGVQEWLGVKTGLGKFKSGTLAHLNDLGFTFRYIADLIESQPEELFEETV